MLAPRNNFLFRSKRFSFKLFVDQLMSSQHISTYVFCVFSSFITMFMFISFIFNEQALTRHSAQRDTENLARGFAETVNNSINDVDQIMMLMRSAYSANPVGIKLSDWTTARKFNTKLTVQISIVDRNGLLLQSSLDMPKTPVNLSDRAHFKAQLNPNADELFISDPVVGRVSNQRTIQLTRKLLNNKGQFSGILVVSLDTDYLSQYYHSFDISNGEILLVSADGVIDARGTLANPTDGIGTSLHNTQLEPMLDAVGPGVIEAESPIDHTERLYAYRPLRDHRLQVAVGLSLEDIRRPMLYRICLATVLCLSILLSILLTGRALRRRQVKEYEAQAALAHAKKLAQLGEMATGIAHELNQPLGVISLSAENCIRAIDVGSSTPERLRSKLNRIIEETVRAATLIEHMRVFGRNDHGPITSIQLQKVMDNVLQIIDFKLSSEHVSLKADLPSDLPPVRAQLVLLEQVLINLIANACHAYGVSTVPAKPSLRTIEITARSWGAMVRINVQDHAGGISEYAMERLFIPFFTTKGVGKGVGLGLAISYGIITDLGGSIVAANQNGGALFTITLPQG